MPSRGSSSSITKTIRWFAVAEAPTDLPRREGLRVRAVDVFQPHLARRWREGEHVAKVLFSEIRGLGYHGSARSVARYVANWRTDEPSITGLCAATRTADARLATAAPAI